MYIIRRGKAVRSRHHLIYNNNNNDTIFMALIASL